MQGARMQDQLFGLVEEATHLYLESARADAARLAQPLDGTHVLRSMLADLQNGPLSGTMSVPLASVLRDMFDPRLTSPAQHQGSISHHLDGDSVAPELRVCAQKARDEAGFQERALSPSMVLWAIIVYHSTVNELLRDVGKLHGLDVAALIQRLHRDFDAATLQSTTSSSRQAVHSVVPSISGLHDNSMSAVVDELAKEMMTWIEPTPDYHFADVHATQTLDIMQNLDRAIRFHRNVIYVRRGMHGTSNERIAQSLSDTLARDDERPLGRYNRVIQVDLLKAYGQAESYGEDIAKSALRNVLTLAATENAVLVFENFQMLDHSAHHANGADEAGHGLRGILTDVHGVPAIALYWIHISGEKVPAGSVLSSDKYQQYPLISEDVEPTSVSQTRAMIAEHFVRYWLMVEQCEVDPIATFDDVYLLSPWVHYEGVPTTLPYLPIYLGTNACKTARAGQKHPTYLKDRAQEALRRLRHLQQAQLPSAVSARVSDEVFESMAHALTDLEHSVQAGSRSNELPHIRRANILAELLGSSTSSIDFSRKAVPIPIDAEPIEAAGNSAEYGQIPPPPGPGKKTGSKGG